MEVHAEGNPSVTPLRIPSSACCTDTGPQQHPELPEPAQLFIPSPKPPSEILGGDRLWHQRVHQHFVAFRGFIAFRIVRPSHSLMLLLGWVDKHKFKLRFLLSPVVLGLESRGFYNSPTCRCKGILLCLCTAWAHHAFIYLLCAFSHFGSPVWNVVQYFPLSYRKPSWKFFKGSLAKKSLLYLSTYVSLWFGDACCMDLIHPDILKQLFSQRVPKVCQQLCPTGIYPSVKAQRGMVWC